MSGWIPNSLGSSYFAKFATNNPIHNIYNNLLNIHHYKKSQYNYQHPYEKNGQVFSGSQKNTIFKSPPIRKQSNFLSKFFQNLKVNELKSALQSVYSTMVKNSVPARPNNIRRQFSLLGSPVSIFKEFFKSFLCHSFLHPCKRNTFHVHGSVALL